MGWRSGATHELATLFSQTKRITRHGRNGDVRKALELFERMPSKNQVTWNAMLSVLIDNGHLDSALRLFDEMPLKNSTSYTATITGLSRSGLVSRARRLFESIPTSDQNVFSWTAMISCYTRNSEPLQAMKLFSGLYSDFFDRKIIPNSHTFSILLKSCCCIRSLVAAKQIHSLIVKLLDGDGEHAIFVLNSLIDVNAKLGNLVYAEGIFDRMKWRDLGSYNTMMDGYTHHLMMGQAIGVFNSMKAKDAFSWNIIMSGLLESHRSEQALRLFLCFLRSGRDSKPNPSTYTIVLTACSNLTVLEFGRQIHASILKNGFYRSNIFVCNSLITMYSSCGLNEELEQVFDEMPKRDVISWNSVIQGLGRNGCGRRALEFAEKALSSKNFNHNTFTAMLTSCSHGGLVVEGLDYFNSMRRKYGIEPSLDHYICVVDILGRAGKLEAAHHLLREMSLAASSAAWGALLNACLIHRNRDIGRIAAQELHIVEPGDARSYLALANIYSNTDKMEDSRELFDSMREKDLRKEPGCSWVVES